MSARIRAAVIEIRSLGYITEPTRAALTPSQQLLAQTLAEEGE